MKYKVLVTPRSYGKADDTVYDILRDNDIQIVPNTTGGILKKNEMMELIKDCDGVILGVDPMDADIINAGKKLKVISKYGVGIDNIDMETAKQNHIQVMRTIGANSAAVADYAMSLVLALMRKVVVIDKNCRNKNWGKIETMEVTGKTIGLLGFGAIGKLVAQRAQGFSMKVMAYDVFWDAEYAKTNDIEYATPEQIYENADIISIHLPLLPETKHMIGAKELSMMKPSAVLVNTARGGIIQEDALIQALLKKEIYGAGIDAFESEPPTDSRWFDMDNVVLGSHCAASTDGASINMSRSATKNLISQLCIKR